FDSSAPRCRRARVKRARDTRRAASRNADRVAPPGASAAAAAEDAAERWSRAVICQCPAQRASALCGPCAPRLSSAIDSRTDAMSSILVEQADGVATITLHRPEVLNSFNRPMARELRDALDDASREAAVRAVLLTGAGRAFCAGQDLAEAALDDGAMPDLGDIVRDSYNPLIRAIRTLEKPVVCAVNGVAAGAGANLALACDIVFASSAASFIQSF